MVRVKSLTVQCFACVLILSVLLISAAFGVSETRSYATDNFLLSIDGSPCGFLRSIDGGGITADVIQEPAGPSYFTKKHIGQPKYQDLKLQIGFPMNPSICNWISDCWSMDFGRHDCVVTVLDYALRPKSAIQYNQALITATTFPACDASSKEPRCITVTLTPQSAREVQASAVAGQLSTNEQKLWLPSDFELKIDGLDCTKVNKIDSFTVNQTTVTDEVGNARDYQKKPGKLEFPNLRIAFPEAALPTWKAWFDSFVVQGHNDESNEKLGRLTFLSPNGQTILLSIDLFNLGIFKLERETVESGGDQTARWVAELYCERMSLPKMGPDSAGKTTSPITTSTSTRIAPSTRSLKTGSSLGATRKFGTNPQFDFTLKSAEYTITRQYVEGRALEADAKSKLMLIRYTIQNPSDRAMNVNTGMMRFQITDSAGANSEVQDISMGSNNQRLSGSLLPGQSLECCAIARVPGNVDADTLTVTCASDSERYAVAGKAQIKEEFARDAAAGPAAAYTALAEISIDTGVFYPMMNLDYRLDGLGLGERPKVSSRARENTRCLIASFTIRNPSSQNIALGSAGFSPMLVMSDGTNTVWQGNPLSSLQDTPVSGDLMPGQEMKMRVFFDVPASDTVTPASFRFSQGRSRVYFVELQQVKEPTRRAG